jgi:hypothetical protein
MTNDPDGAGISLQPYDHLSAVLTSVNRAAVRVSRLAYFTQFQSVDSRSPFAAIDRRIGAESLCTNARNFSTTATFSASMRFETHAPNGAAGIKQQLNELGCCETAMNVAKFDLIFD